MTKDVLVTVKGLQSMEDRQPAGRSRNGGKRRILL